MGSTVRVRDGLLEKLGLKLTDSEGVRENDKSLVKLQLGDEDSVFVTEPERVNVGSTVMLGEKDRL